MHELSVCMALLEQVQAIADDRGAAAVTEIVIGIGPLSGVEADLLRRAYPLAAAGTIAADATLLIRHSDVCVRCSQCGNESTVPPNRLTCPRCGDFRTHVVTGDELVLERVELETSAERRDNAASTDEQRPIGA